MSITMTLADWGSLFLHFISLSLLAVGGAITTAPDIHRYLVDETHWLSDTQFTSSIALAQGAPGPNVMFVALMGWNVGLNAGGGLAAGWPAVALALWGVLITMVGIMIPSCTLTFVATANATLQLTSDPAMRGRVMALYAMAFLGSTAELPRTTGVKVATMRGVDDTSAVYTVTGATARRNALVDENDTSGLTVDATDLNLPATLSAELASGHFLTSAEARKLDALAVELCDHGGADVLDVVDLIEARVHGRQRVHGVGDVARDGHAELVGLGGDRAQDVERDRAVDLDLIEALRLSRLVEEIHDLLIHRRLLG